MFFDALYRPIGPVPSKSLADLMAYLSSPLVDDEMQLRKEKPFLAHACRIVTVMWHRRVTAPKAHVAMLPLLRYIRETLGAPGSILSGRLLYRAELSFVPPGAKVMEHHDSQHFHKVADRLHVPLVADKTCFESRWFGGAWESFVLEPRCLYRFNNRVPHRVANQGDGVRVHAILDYVTLADAKAYANQESIPMAYQPVTEFDPEYRFIGRPLVTS